MYRRKYKQHSGLVKKAPAKLNKRQKTQVKRLIGKRTEQKYFDLTYTYTQVDRAGILNVLSNVPQGVAQQQRVGDRITMKSLELRITLYYNGSLVAYNTTHNVRVLLFRWTINNAGAPPIMSNIFQYAGAGGDYRNTVSPINWQTHAQKDIVVLHDRIYSVGAQDKAPVIQFKRKRIRGNVDFDIGASTGEGQLYLMVLADDATGAHTPSVQAQAVARLHYTDA